MIEVIDYRIGHLDFLEPHELYDEEKDLFTRTHASALNSSSCYTLIWDDRVLSVVGIMVPWPGLGEVWSLSSKLVKKCPKEYVKALKHLIGYELDKHNLTRIQVGLSHKFEQRMKWGKAIGFEYETTLKKYGPDGSDYDLFARFK